MPKYALIDGANYFYHCRKSVPEFAEKVYAMLRESFPLHPPTHISGAYDFHQNPIPITSTNLPHFLESDYRHIEFTRAFSGLNVEPLIEHWLNVSISDFHFLDTECVICSVAIHGDLVKRSASGPLAFLDRMAAEFGIESGNWHDSSDSSNQGTDHLHTIKVLNYKILTERRVYDPLMKEVRVDLEAYPCHSHIFKTVAYTSRWTNYLGRDYLDSLGFRSAEEIVPLVKDIAHEVVVFNDSLVRVTLFKDPFAYDEPENRERLWAFRRRLKIDEVAHELLPPERSPNRYIPLSGHEQFEYGAAQASSTVREIETLSTKRNGAAEDIINYDEIIFLDAEDLAEIGMAFGYEQVRAEFRKRTIELSPIEEIIDRENCTYHVIHAGRTYLIYSHMDDEHSWANAAVALFEIVNSQLQDEKVRMYAINGGNDLAGTILTSKEFEAARKQLENRKDWPYLPTHGEEWLGQPH